MHTARGARIQIHTVHRHTHVRTRHDTISQAFCISSCAAGAADFPNNCIFLSFVVFRQRQPHHLCWTTHTLYLTLNETHSLTRSWSHRFNCGHGRRWPGIVRVIHAIKNENYCLQFRLKNKHVIVSHCVRCYTCIRLPFAHSPLTASRTRCTIVIVKSGRWALHTVHWFTMPSAHSTGECQRFLLWLFENRVDELTWGELVMDENLYEWLCSAVAVDVPNVRAPITNTRTRTRKIMSERTRTRMTALLLWQKRVNDMTLMRTHFKW